MSGMLACWHVCSLMHLVWAGVGAVQWQDRPSVVMCDVQHMAGNTMGHCTVVFFGFLLQLKNRLCQREPSGENCSRHGCRGDHITVRRAATSVQVLSAYSEYKWIYAWELWGTRECGRHIDVLGNATPYSLAEVADVSEEMSTSIITVEEWLQVCAA